MSRLLGLLGRDFPNKYQDRLRAVDPKILQGIPIPMNSKLNHAVRHQADEFDGLAEPPTWYMPLKRAFDLLASVVMMVLLAPLILFLMGLVKLTSPGPALYSQVRLGRDRRPFTIYKIRSMHYDCERLTGPRWAAAAGDPRITPLGRFLRATHLDELPQLWNVVRGDMSLIGPRPERPEFVEQLERMISGYQHRLVVRPGVTGLAQVQLPADTDLRSVQRKVNCDLYYVERMNGLLDLRILMATATKVIGVPCPVACRILGIPMEQDVRASRPDEIRSDCLAAADPA
jgi:lipopolysaccharide/colanic/teichoic acid biosynthesis glycosyltransferase